MWRYLFRRVVAFIPTLIIAVTLVFVFTRMIPGNPVWSMMGFQGVSDEQIQRVSHDLGLDKPIIYQYVTWLPRALTGNFGTSLFFTKTPSQVIIDRFPITISIASMAFVFMILVGVPLGILSAVRQNTAVDRGSLIFAILGVSLPSFWLGFLLMLLFAVQIPLFPAAGYTPLSFGFVRWIRGLVLPVFTVSLPGIAVLTRTTRSAMLEVLNQEYIVAARAKGLSQTRVIFKHALRNGVIAVVTVAGMMFANSLGGATIIENVFAIPGFGTLMTLAAVRRDYPILEGGMVYLTFIALLVNLLVDLSYALINPRVSYE